MYTKILNKEELREVARNKEKKFNSIREFTNYVNNNIVSAINIIADNTSYAIYNITIDNISINCIIYIK